MTKTNKNGKKQITELEKDPLSTAQVLQKVGDAVNREKNRRENIQKNNNSKVVELGPDALVKRGDKNFCVPMPQDLATLKALIQTIVRDELGKSQRD